MVVQVEVGPYVYQQHRRKVDVMWDDEGRVLFKVNGAS